MRTLQRGPPAFSSSPLIPTTSVSSSDRPSRPFYLHPTPASTHSAYLLVMATEMVL